MIITLDKTYYARVDSPLLGYMGETESRTITVQGYQTEGADRYILRFSYADGAQYDVDITDGAYTVQASLLRAVGNVKCQLLAVKSTGEETYEYVKKSNVFVVTIKQSVGGETPVPTYEETVAVLDKVLAAEIAADECIAARDTAVAAAGTATEKAAVAVDKATEAAKSAEISAENASQTSADRTAVESAKAEVLSARDTAVGAADTATEKAQTAIDNAETASTAAATATTANNAAQTARNAAEQAATAAEDNKTTAVNAAQAATQAANTANGARDTAVSARDTATAAADTAVSAKTAAETAKATAETAAQTATEKATEISASAEQISTNAADISGLKSDLGDVKNVTVTEKYSTNLYNEANAEVGYRCAGGGVTVTAENSVLSEFIEIPDGTTYAVPSAYFNGGYRVFCYSYGFADESKKTIAGSGGNQTSAISIPDGAKYFRCSWLTTTTGQRFINFNTDGSLFPYEEYYEPIISVKTAEDVTEKLNEHEIRISDLENFVVDSDVKRVICWGDSLTDGAGASDTNHQYPYVLKSLINANNTGIVTDSAGQGGEGTHNIATRQGGIVVNIKPCTIPASGSVNVEIDKWNGLTISLCRRGGNDVTTDNAKMKINPCYIAGVKGTLLRDSNSNYVFTRAEDGEEVTITRPMPLLTNAHENYNGKNEVAVIWSGTNDIASNGGTIEKTIRGINMMIAKLKSKKYIVVGLTSKAYHTDIDDKNFRMATEYKDHFVNVRDYMLVYGLEDSGIEPTEQDLTDISNGEIPSSLRVDDVHGNDYFYDIVAKQVYKKGQELGYWN